MARNAAVLQEWYPMSLSIPPEFERAILERVESGEYRSTDEVLRLCLRLLEMEEMSEGEKLEALRRDVAHAMGQYDRGEYSPADEVFARLHATLERNSDP
jgi:putative addiction module CopG family antidote